MVINNLEERIATAPPWFHDFKWEYPWALFFLGYSENDCLGVWLSLMYKAFTLESTLSFSQL